MFVKALHSIGHAGELHPPGAILDIPEAEVDRLLDLGAVAVLVEPSETPAPAEVPTRKGKK